ncbi:ead/Ea22-like family protein [Klebsiella pneumoniae]
MTDITELAQRMKAAAEKATPGEWWADEVKNEGCYGSGDDCVEGFTSYAIYGSDGQTLFDSLNSDAACICEEYDGEGHVAWDETAQRNAEFITLANPANVLALVEALEKAQTINAAAEKLVRCKGRYHSEQNYRALAALFGVKTPDLPPLEHENVHYADAAEMEIAALRQRIAELEPFHTAYIEWSDKTAWVQTDKRFDVLKPWGKHRADVLKEYIQHLESRTVTMKQGEVLVTVAGFTGCGKSAIAGEIEIAMKAIGVPVTWANGDSEKRMTGADWLTAIEMYKPTVRIVEVNIPRAAGIKVEAE